MTFHLARTILGLICLVLAISACSSASSRQKGSILTPAERMEHKRALLVRHDQNLTPAQKMTLTHHPGWTRSELNAAVERMIEYNDTLERAAAARVEVGDVHRVRGESSPYVLSSDADTASGDLEGEDEVDEVIVDPD